MDAGIPGGMPRLLVIDTRPMVIDVCQPANKVVTGMHFASAPEALRTARPASGSRVVHFLARTGLTARGVIYVLVGWVTALVALGHS
jgi:hypothetical protein